METAKERIYFAGNGRVSESDAPKYFLISPEVDTPQLKTGDCVFPTDSCTESQEPITIEFLCVKKVVYAQDGF
jgi:hypothetical protein